MGLPLKLFGKRAAKAAGSTLQPQATRPVNWGSLFPPGSTGRAVPQASGPYPSAWAGRARTAPPPRAPVRMPAASAELESLIETITGQTTSPVKQRGLRAARRAINKEFGGEAPPAHFIDYALGHRSPIENLLYTGANQGRREARLLRQSGKTWDESPPAAVESVARSMETRSARIDATIDRTLGKRSGFRDKLQGDDVKSFARSKGKQRKLKAQRAGKWKSGSTLTSATGLKRQLHDIGGMRVSVLGDMPAESHWAHLVKEMEAAGSGATADVAADIANVQVVNLPGYNTHKLAKNADDSVYGTASQGGHVRDGRAPTDRHIRLNNDLISKAPDEGTGWTVGERGEKMLGEVFTHEFGHQFDFSRGISAFEHGEWELTGQGRKLYDDAFGTPGADTVINEELTPNMFKRVTDAREDPEGWQAKTRLHVGRSIGSRYSTWNATELTAETYAAARLGDPRAMAMVKAANEAPRPAKAAEGAIGHRAQIGQRAEEGRSQVEPGTGRNRPRKVRGIEFGHGKVLKRDR